MLLCKRARRLIRAFEPGGADAPAALFHASVQQIGILACSPEQATAWSAAKPEAARYLQQATGRTFLVAMDTNGRVGNLCRFGKAARKQGISTLSVEASVGARRLFEQQGFRMKARHDFNSNNVAMHNYRMSKQILGK